MQWVGGRVHMFFYSKTWNPFCGGWARWPDRCTQVYCSLDCEVFTELCNTHISPQYTMQCCSVQCSIEQFIVSAELQDSGQCWALQCSAVHFTAIVNVQFYCSVACSAVTSVPLSAVQCCAVQLSVLHKTMQQTKARTTDCTLKF